MDCADVLLAKTPLSTRWSVTLSAELKKLVTKSFQAHLHPFFAEAQFIPYNRITHGLLMAQQVTK